MSLQMALLIDMNNSSDSVPFLNLETTLSSWLRIARFSGIHHSNNRTVAWVHSGIIMSSYVGVVMVNLLTASNMVTALIGALVFVVLILQLGAQVNFFTDIDRFRAAFQVLFNPEHNRLFTVAKHDFANFVNNRVVPMIYLAVMVCVSVTTILPLLTNATPHTAADFAFLVIILLAPYLLVNSIVCFSTYFIITAAHLFALQAIAKHIEEHQHNLSELCADNDSRNGSSREISQFSPESANQFRYLLEVFRQCRGQLEVTFAAVRVPLAISVLGIASLTLLWIVVLIVSQMNPVANPLQDTSQVTWAFWCVMYTVVFLLILFRLASVSSAYTEMLPNVMNRTSAECVRQCVMRDAGLMTLMLQTRESNMVRIVGVEITNAFVVQVAYVLGTVILFMVTNMSRSIQRS